MNKMILGLAAVCLMIAFQNCSNGASFQSAGELVVKADGDGLNTGDGGSDPMDPSNPAASPTPTPSTPPTSSCPSCPTLPPGVVQPPGVTLPPGTVIPPGSTLPPGVVQPPGITLPPGTVIPPGVVLPPGTVIPPGVIAPPGTTTPSCPPGKKCCPIKAPPAGHTDRDDCRKGPNKDPNTGLQERDHEHGLTSPKRPLEYVCVLEGSGKSLKIGLVEYLSGKKGTPNDVCMTENACLNILSKKFKVKSAERRGFCPDKNPHVTPMTDTEIEESLKETEALRSLNR